MRDLPENFFQLRSLSAQKHDVAGGAVQVGQAGTAQIPYVAQMAQIFGAVVFAGRLVHAHRVEVGHAGELFGLVAVTADDAAAVTEYAHDPAVFPVGFTFFVRKFKHAQQVFGGVGGNLVVEPFRIRRTISSSLLDVGHKAGPGPGFELVQQGGFMFCHCLTSTWVNEVCRSGAEPGKWARPLGNGPLINRPEYASRQRVNRRKVCCRI